MPLNDKIVQYLAEHGVPGARIKETVIIIPTATGEMHRVIFGFIDEKKLDSIVAEWKSVQADAA
jgi:uncharacterized protein (DUF1810 family)